MMKRAYVLPMLCSLLFLIACQPGQTQSSKTDLSAKEFQEKIQSTNNKIILDVRTPEEYAEGHIAGALNVDWNGDHFNVGVARLDKNLPVMVYCAGGGRSSSAAKSLRQKGFREVYNLEDGLNDWQDKGLPVTKD